MTKAKPRFLRHGPGLVLLVLTAAAWSDRPAAACDSTSCLLVTRGSAGLLARGTLRLDVSFRQTDESVLLSGTEKVAEVRRPKLDFENARLRPGYHNELGGRGRFVQFDASYGLTGRTSLFLSVPAFSDRAYDIGHPPVVRETYGTRGLGDALLGVRHAVLVGRDQNLVGTLGLQVPTGSHRLTSPPGLVDVGILDPSLQPGSGSLDLSASLQYWRRLNDGGLSLSGAASYQANTANDLDYRYGNDAIASLTLSRPVGGRLSTSVQIKWARSARSRYQDEVVPSTGGRVAYVIPGATLAGPGGTSFYGFMPIPVYRYVNESQLGPSVGVVVGVARSF